ncbi:SDR family oxidoreductase [Aquabacterium sp. A7-Y]|uniref:SDR family oxidoreductase n=1 Tax=Aquabacterium sp. A7-Y TaxID=1349605 RepID=UPI00223E794B|nr:SDR family oxidoreductase [Aquabacterium sp. A7-Y]MCW7538478.1 SDR family oxidoreductase [Aquabacterium sp. A7-Y]
MSRTLKPLHQQTLVVTGASSGIGLATAQMAARRGARVLLVARDESGLAAATRQIVDEGGQAMYVVADVGRREDLQLAADTAIENFGGFDTWVNNAGVSIWGKLEDVRDRDHQRLFETNFWGVVYGSTIAAAHLRDKGGAIINLGSMASDRAIPLQGMYSASKHAVKGFTDSLRMELEEEGAPISVTLIKPAGIGTPFTEHAKNYTDHEPRLPPPVYRPEDVAEAILYAAEHPRRDLFIGSASKMMGSASNHVPGLLDWIGRKLLVKAQLRDEAAQHRQGALYEPGGGGRVRGDHPGQVVRPSLYTKAMLHPKSTGAVVVAGLAALAWVASGPLRRRHVW